MEIVPPRPNHKVEPGITHLQNLKILQETKQKSRKRTYEDAIDEIESDEIEIDLILNEVSERWNKLYGDPDLEGLSNPHSQRQMLYFNSLKA